MTVTLRPVHLRDGGELASLTAGQREYLKPFEPTRPARYFTTAGQRDRIRAAVRASNAGAGYLFVITVDEAMAGTLALTRVIPAPLAHATLGYWVAEPYTGRGVATRAVTLALRHAFGALQLRRLEAGTLLSNIASQRVLQHNGFRTIGISRAYLEIAGSYQDHLLFERLIDDPHPMPSLVGVDNASIRPALPRDAEALAALLNDVALEPAAPLLTLGGVSVRAERRRLRQAEGSDAQALLVAEEGNAIIGRIDLWRDQHPHAQHAAEVGIAVGRHARGRGVATALLSAGAAWGRSVGVSRLEAYVLPHNAASLAFFRRHGFTDEGFLHGRFLRCGQALDAVLLARAI